MFKGGGYILYKTNILYIHKTKKDGDKFHNY